MLSGLAELALELAGGFQAQALAALKTRLRQERGEARREAQAHRGRRQDKKGDRRHAVAQCVSRAIADERPEAKERLTTELWERLTEDDRIDADLADTGPPPPRHLQMLAHIHQRG